MSVAVEECVADAIEVSSMDLVAFYFLFFGWMDPCIKLEDPGATGCIQCGD
jgi:hypothetical protein